MHGCCLEEYVYWIPLHCTCYISAKIQSFRVLHIWLLTNLSKHTLTQSCTQGQKPWVVTFQHSIIKTIDPSNLISKIIWQWISLKRRKMSAFLRKRRCSSKYRAVLEKKNSYKFLQGTCSTRVVDFEVGYQSEENNLILIVEILYGNVLLWQTMTGSQKASTCRLILIMYCFIEGGVTR